jgi:hypothetical protein
MRRLYPPALLIAAALGVSACSGGTGSSAVPGAGRAADAPSSQARAVMSIGGPTCNVPTDYPTIQAAVNAPACTTIKVAPGTYTENVTIPRTVTLRGAQAGRDARNPRGSESVINGGIGPDVTISANNVTVDGFTLNGPVSQGTAAIVMMGANSGETIENNVVNNPGRAASFNTSNTLFFQNLVKSTPTAGDGFQANTSPVQNVLLASNTFGGANGAIYNADITIIEGTANIGVTGNTGNGDGTLVALFKTNHALVAGNTIKGDGASSAIYIGGADSNVLVDCNTVSGAGTGVNVANDFADGPNSAVTIVGNNLHNNTSGVKIGAAAVAAANTVVANRNRLTGNTAFGVNNLSPFTVDATRNWWGAANGPGPVGPGSGDRVTANVTYAPWLRNANDATCGEGNDGHDGHDGDDGHDGHDNDGHDGHDK